MDGLIRGLFIYAWVLQNISQPAALACQHTGTNNPFRNNVFSSIRHVSRLAWFFSGHFVRSTLPCFLFGLAFYPPFCPLICHVSYLVWLYSYHSFRFTLPFLMFGLAFYPPFFPLYSTVLLLGKAIPTPFCPFFITMLLIGFGYSTHSCYCFLLLIKMYLVFTIFYRPQIDIYCIYGAHRSNGHIKHLGSSCVHCVQSPGIPLSLFPILYPDCGAFLILFFNPYPYFLASFWVRQHFEV